MNQMAGLNTNTALYGQAIAPKDVKGTAVDSINANIESMTNRLNTLAQFAGRISDGILGFDPTEGGASNSVRPVSQSTQDHMRDLEAAFDRLSTQINRLG